MRKVRFLVPAFSLVTILGGALLLSAPRPASASAACCITNVKELAEELRDICGPGGGSGELVCFSDGTCGFASVSCDS